MNERSAGHSRQPTAHSDSGRNLFLDATGGAGPALPGMDCRSGLHRRLCPSWLEHCLARCDSISVDFAKAVAVLAYFVISIGYGIGTEWHWRGQTVGKRLLRLRVMDVSGFRLHFSQIAIRNLLRVVDMLPAFYLVGGAACLISQRAQRLGDFAANTIVIVQPQYAEPALDQLLSGKYNSLRNHPHLAARLRQRVSPAEARVALQALLRREDFEPASRVELFSELGSHFRSLVTFPQEAVEGLSDEQYVRNVVDVVFRSRPAELTNAVLCTENK